MTSKAYMHDRQQAVGLLVGKKEGGIVKCVDERVVGDISIAPDQGRVLHGPFVDMEVGFVPDVAQLGNHRLQFIHVDATCVRCLLCCRCITPDDVPE